MPDRRNDLFSKVLDLILSSMHWFDHYFTPEIDISVSKLFGFETFAKSLRVSVSVSENLVSEKKSRFRFRKNLVSEKSLGFGFGKFGLGRKVSVSVSEKFGLGKKSRFRFQKIWYHKKSLGIGFGQIFGIVIQWSWFHSNWYFQPIMSVKTLLTLPISHPLPSRVELWKEKFLFVVWFPIA